MRAGGVTGRAPCWSGAAPTGRSGARAAGDPRHTARVPVVTFPFAEPERVLLAGDWHGSSHEAELRIAYAADAGCPVLIQLGDFGVWPGDSGRRYLDLVSAVSVGCDVVTLVVDGNHEDFDQLLSLPVDPATGLRPLAPSVWHLPRGSRWSWAGARFTALGGGTSLDRSVRTPHETWWPQEAITPEQAQAVMAEAECDVLLTHDCPEGVPIPGTDRESSLEFWPEQELRTAWAHRELLAEVAAVLRPTHLWHGHFHMPYRCDVELVPGVRTRAQGLGAEFQGLSGVHELTLATLAPDIARRRTG